MFLGYLSGPFLVDVGDGDDLRILEVLELLHMALALQTHADHADFQYLTIHGTLLLEWIAAQTCRRFETSGRAKTHFDGNFSSR